MCKKKPGDTRFSESSYLVFFSLLAKSYAHHMLSHVLKFTPRTTNMLQQVIKSYFNKGGMNVQQLKVKAT